MYSRRIIGFLRVNCIFIRFFDTGPDPTQPVPPKTETLVIQPDRTVPDPWVDSTCVQLWRPVYERTSDGESTELF